MLRYVDFELNKVFPIHKLYDLQFPELNGLYPLALKEGLYLSDKTLLSGWVTVKG